MRFREQRCYDGVDDHAKGAQGDAVAEKRRRERDAVRSQPSPVLLPKK
jgi:hypothetical protein